MDGKDACDRQSNCSCPCGKLQKCWSHEKILDEAGSTENLSSSVTVLKSCNKGQAFSKAALRHVMQTMLVSLEGSEAHFIFLSSLGDSLNELIVLRFLISLASDTPYLEEMAKGFEIYPGDGNLMNNVGVMLTRRMKYNLSEKFFLRALDYFQHKGDHMGTAVVTVNLAAFHRICGDLKKAHIYCNDAVELCLVITSAPPTDLHLLWKVVFRLNLLCQNLKNYKSCHDILRVAVKFDVNGTSDALAVKYVKQLMTLQLKEHQGEKNKREELEEFALQLFAADAFMKAELLTADFITTVMTLAEMYCSIKCLKEARQLIDKLESTFLHVYGGNGPLFGFLQYQIGHFKVKYCEASEAQSTLQEAEEILIRYFSRGYHMVGSCKSLQGTCASHKGNQKAACHYLKEACTIFEKINHHHPKVGEILLKVADLESKAGNFENAKLIIEEALEKFILACGEVSLQTALAYLQGASILRRKGKFMRSALVKLKKANDIFVHHGLQHDHPDVAFCHYLQGQLLHSLGQVKEAAEEFLFVHHQLSSRDDFSMKTEVIDPEFYRMFFVVDVDGVALRGSLCCHFLSLVSLADVKTGDEKRDHMKEIFSCLQELDSTILTVSDYLGKHVHCTLQRILEADMQVYFVLIPDSAAPLGKDESFSSKYSSIEKKQPGDYDNVYLLSSCSNHGKAPQLLLFWKTSDVLETGDVSCVTSSFRESVKLLCLQPKFRKTFLERQELFMKLPIQEKSPALPSLSSQIDSLPLLAELELSKSHNQYDSIDSFPTASTVWPLAHVSYFSYRFSSSSKALLVFYKWISSLGRKLELLEVRSISTPEVSSPSQRNCAVHFTLFDPIYASLSLAVEERSVHVKCRTVKESGSTCICSSVRSALESTVKAQESDVVGSVFEQSLWLPCMEDDGEYDKEPTKGYNHCKDSQQESSSLSYQKLDLHPQTNWESDSDLLKTEPSVDLSQNEDTECPSFTAHPDDTISIDACVQPLEFILRERQLSSEVQLSCINNPLHTTNGTEEHVNSLLSPGSSSSLNCLPSSQIDASNETLEFKQEALLCLEDVHEEICSGKKTDKVLDSSSTSEAVFFNSHYHESANCEEGLIADYQCSLETKENLQRNEIPQKTCRVKRVGVCFNKEESRPEDHGIEFDQSPGPSLTTAERENEKGTVAIESLVCELQDEVAFYQDQCRKLREELVKLKEKWKLCEDEKQDLQAEVGRQLFLESKERRCSKIYQPLREHASGMSMPGRVRGSSHDFSATEAKLLGGASPLNKSGLLLQQRLQEISNSLSELELSRIKSLVRPLLDCLRLARIREGSELFKELERKGELSYSFVRDLLERIHRFDLVEKLAVPYHNGNELYREESYLSQENNQQDEASESVSGVDGRQADEVEEWNDIFDNTEADGEVQFCNSSNIYPFNSDSEVAAVNFHAEIMNESSFIHVDLSKERCDSASSLSQSFDAPSIGVVSDERSQSPSGTGEQFESGELKGACGAGDERGREGSNESSLRDGAEGQFNFNHHFNDTVDGAVNLSDRAQDSLMPEDFTGVNQDSFPRGGTAQRQNVSGARITVKKDRAVDQTGSRVSNESNKWEHLGARPRDSPPKIDRSSEPSLLYSLENLVPPQVSEPVAHGVANAFLARHSEDKHLHESLYYTNGQEMFTENSSLLGASHVAGMINLMDSNKAKQNLGDCQFATRPDSYNQPHSSLFPQTSGAYIGGNNGLNIDFNLLNPNVANDCAPCTGMQDGTFPFLQRDELLHSGFTGSGLTSDFMRATGSQTGAFHTSNYNFSINDYAIGTREPQIPPDWNFSSLQINQPIRSGFNGSGFSFGLTGTTGREMTHSAAGTHSNNDFSGSASMLPSTTNPGLPGTSSVNMQTYDYSPDASPTASLGARANGSDNRLLSGLESSSDQLLSFTTGSDVLNTSSQGNSSSNVINTAGDCVASGHFREESRAHNSSSSGLISGINTGRSLNEQSGQTGDSVANRNYGTESVESTDNSLLELEQRVEEACAMVERVLREREEREEFGREIERKEREIRAERARKKRERETRELEEARGWPQQQEPVTGQSLWLCEHYQRHCRVRFPCCTNFYSCHRCHNNSKECDNEEAKASHATHLKCSYCHHEQEIAEDSAKCRSCGAKMSAYFCGICKHFTSIDKNPYHCDKCGICRIHKDKSFHCDVCNVCLDKRLQGKHKCRPNSGHDECCICLEDAFSGCQILPCSHKVHRECAIAMIQNGIRTCPVCRHPLYSPAPE